MGVQHVLAGFAKRLPVELPAPRPLIAQTPKMVAPLALVAFAKHLLVA